VTALEQYPRELSLSRRPRDGKYVLWVHAPGISGQIITGSEAGARRLAEVAGEVLAQIEQEETT
jgi:hypothetical protein